MSNALKKAAEIRRQTRERMQQGQPEGGEAPATTQDKQPQGQPTQPQQAQPSPAPQAADPTSSFEGSNGLQASDPSDEPSTANGQDDDPQDVNKDLAQWKDNYAHVRAYADRKANEAADAKRELEAAQRQIDLLLNQQTAKPSTAAPTQQQGQPQAPQQSGQAEGEPKPEVPVQQPGETAHAYLQRLQAVRDDYPEIAGPLWEAFEARMNEVVDNISQRIDQTNQVVVDEVDRNRRAEANSHQQRWISSIQERHSDFPDVAYSPEFQQFLDKHPLGRSMRAHIFPNREAGERGGTPAEVIAVLDQYRQQNPIPGADKGAGPEPSSRAPDGDTPPQQQQQQRDLRQPTSEADVDLNGGSGGITNQGEAPTFSRAQLAELAKDPKKWRENQHLIRQAQQAGRITN